MKRSLFSRRTPSESPDVAVPPAHPADVALVAQLWAHQFEQMTTLGLAGGGGLLVLLQTGVVTATNEFWISLFLFAFLGAVSVVGQTAVVDDATRGKPPGRQARVIRGLGMLALGAAAMGTIDLLT